MDQTSRVTRLVLWSYGFALPLCCLAFWPTYLEPQLKPKSHLNALWELCAHHYFGWDDRPGCLGHEGFGSMWSRIDGPRWRLVYRTERSANRGFIVANSAFAALSVAVATDVTIAVMCVRLLVRLRRYRQVRGTLRQLSTAESEQKTRAEAQKTIILLSLCFIILLQLFTLVLSMTCPQIVGLPSLRPPCTTLHRLPCRCHR